MRRLFLLCLISSCSTSFAANIYLVPLANNNGVLDATDNALVSCLRTAGHQVLVAPQAGEFDLADIPTSTQVIWFRQGYYAAKLTAGGQAMVANFVNQGGGLILGGDEYPQTGFDTLMTVSPYTAVSGLSTSGYSLNVSVADPYLNAGLGATTGFANEYYGLKAKVCTPASGATVYYRLVSPNHGATAYDAVVGKRFGAGRSLAVPFAAYDLHVGNSGARRFLSNCADWAANGRAHWIMLQNTDTGSVYYQKVVNSVLSGARTWVNGPGNKAVPLIGTGDCNGDGMLDLAFQNNSTGAVSQWLMNPLALPKAQTTVPISSPRPKTNTAIGIGDFSHDGRADVLYYNPTSNQLEVDVHQGFMTVSTVALNSPMLAGFTPVTVGDVNGDGYVDVLWKSNTTGAVSYWKMNGMSVTATVTITKPMPAGYSLRGAGDFSGDSRADLLLLNASTRKMMGWRMNEDGVTATALDFGILPSFYVPKTAGMW